MDLLGCQLSRRTFCYIHVAMYYILSIYRHTCMQTESELKSTNLELFI